MPDEVLVQDARFHGFYTFSAFSAIALWTAMGWGLQYGLYRFTGHWQMIPLYVGLGIGCWICFWMMLKKWTTEIILTDKRILYKRGFFFVNINEVDIEQLASDNVEQSLLGRILDYGDLHIRCIEADDIWLPPIAKPYEFRNALEREKHKYREHYMRVERLRRHSANQDSSHQQAFNTH